MSRVARALTSTVLVGAALLGCTSARDDESSGIPGGTVTSTVPSVEPEPVPTAAQPLVDGLIANFTDGVSLVARVDASAAPCVARRWIGILGPSALLEAGATSETMSRLTLTEVAGLLPEPLDADRADAMVDSFAACEVDYDGAVLASMRAAGTVDEVQQECIAAALPEDLLGAVTSSVLRGEPLDATLDEQYEAAVGPCL